MSGEHVKKIAQRLQQLWYEKTSFLLKSLIPLSWLYLLVIMARKAMYRFGIKKVSKFSVPIIVVGNITVGGTGKTPFVIWLANFLKAQGYHPGIVSRGYAGSANQQPTSVTQASDPSLVGDEAVLIARHSHCPVVVARQRVSAVHYLLEIFHSDIVISDDGLQHYAMGRDIEVAMLDGQRRLGNRYCLPAGPLREPVRRLKEVNFTIVTDGTPMAHEFAMTLKADQFYQLQNPSNIQAAAIFQHKKCYAVAGIGNPDRFFSTLKHLNVFCQQHPFSDHYSFQLSDFNFAEPESVIVMTEKDAVKCQAFADERFWCLPVKASVDHHFAEQLMKRLKK